MTTEVTNDAVAPELDPARMLCDSSTGKSYRADDPNITVRARFAPTSNTVWDLVGQKLLCLVCTRWTDAMKFPRWQRLLGRIECEHCGDILQP